MKIEMFLKQNFMVLNFLFDNRLDEFESRITQEEISENLNLSRSTITRIMNELKDEGLVTVEKKKGRYILSKEAVNLVKKVRKL